MALVGMAREKVENLLDLVREANVFIVKKGVPSKKFGFSFFIHFMERDQL